MRGKRVIPLDNLGKLQRDNISEGQQIVNLNDASPSETVPDENITVSENSKETQNLDKPLPTVTVSDSSDRPIMILEQDTISHHPSSSSSTRPGKKSNLENFNVNVSSRSPPPQSQRASEKKHGQAHKQGRTSQGLSQCQKRSPRSQ